MNPPALLNSDLKNSRPAAACALLSAFDRQTGCRIRRPVACSFRHVMSVSLPSFASLKILKMSLRARSSSSRYSPSDLCPRTVTSSGGSADSAWASARPERTAATLTSAKARRRRAARILLLPGLLRRSRAAARQVAHAYSLEDSDLAEAARGSEGVLLRIGALPRLAELDRCVVA